MNRSFLCVTGLMLGMGAALAQDCKKMDYSSEQQQYMEAAVQQYSLCQSKTEASCRSFLAQSVEHIYSIKDFGSDASFASANEIGKRVTTDATWEHLGSASDPDVLKKALSSANCGQAVLAVMTSDSGGHVAMILPGTMSPSGGWKMEVPNSASFFMNNPAKSYTGKPLSYAFATPNGIEIYVKKNDVYAKKTQ